MPASANFFSVAPSLEAGPIVQTILALFTGYLRFLIVFRILLLLIA